MPSAISLPVPSKRRIANEILMHFRNLKKSAQDVYISDPIDYRQGRQQPDPHGYCLHDASVFDSIDLKLKSEKLYRYIGNSGLREKADHRYEIRPMQ